MTNTKCLKEYRENKYDEKIVIWQEETATKHVVVVIVEEPLKFEKHTSV